MTSLAPTAVTSRTGLCCLIGNPVEHSISPQMHNAAFQRLGLGLVYLAFRVERRFLGEAVKGLKSIHVKGFNITTPHKETIIKHLDKVDIIAENTGAVNTVLKEKGMLIGFNTDGTGFVKAVGKDSLRDRCIAVLGAGGAARSIIFETAKFASSVMVINRTFSRAEALACEVSKQASTRAKIESMPLNRKSFERVLKDCEFVANTSTVGMYPQMEQTPIPVQYLKSDLTVFDAVYNPLKTRLLREAEMIGARTISGLDMLIHQGGEAIKIWTGLDPPIRVMKNAAIEALRTLKTLP